jgi:FkbM family methyltransferase
MGFRISASKLRQRFTGFFDQSAILQRLDRMQLQLDRLERMSHGGRATYVGNDRILTKCVIAEAVIGFLVEADDVLLSPWLILSGKYEIDITNFFLNNLRINSRCLDVGANFGFFTCLMARFCHQGKVIGIEPNNHVYELLRDNIYINGLQAWTTPKHAAIGDSVGTLRLYRRIKRSGNTSLFNVSEALLEELGEPKSEPFEVACLRIDDLLPEFANRLDFIKIDVEGAEPLAMRGARQAILANPQLNIVMEWSPGQIQAAGFNVAEFVDELSSMGLQSAEIGPNGVEAIPLEGLVNLGYRAGILLTCSK